MRSYRTRVAVLTPHLAAVAGRQPRAQETPGATRIEVGVPLRLGEPGRRALLVALAEADRYGHDITADGETVWAEIDQ
ncbi:hypothetical protein [Streptomyces lavendofoliae]|uniref:hypothetical protein n=1 Tax=Streptomyces lavendofoliae TaxID=67314 RepID=UPI00300ECE5F